MLAEWFTIASGDQGIAQTLATMRALALAAAQDPTIVQAARRVVRDVDGHDRWDTTAALFDWFTARYVYTLDPTGYELVVAPAVMLRQGARLGYLQGDCDDAVTLLSALLESVGIPTRFRVVSTSTPLPGDAGYSHVLLEAETEPGEWWPLDVTLDGARPGDRPPPQASEALYDASGFHVEEPAMIRRLGQWDFDASEFSLSNGGGGIALDPYGGGYDLGVSPVLNDPMYPDLGSGFVSVPGQLTMPSAGVTRTTDWGKIFGDVTGAVVKIGAGALPVLERYGALTPTPGSIPLQYPGETPTQYAARLAAGGFGSFFQTTPTSTLLLFGGGALLLLFLLRGRGRR